MPHNESAYIGLNQEKTCIVTNLQGGYDLFKMDPLQRIVNNNKGKYRIIEMFGSSSLIAVVGSGEDPSYSTRHLHLINLVDSSEICNLTFISSIIAVKMSFNRLVVALQDRTYIYGLSDMKLLHIINDVNNDKGIITVSYNQQNNILCYPISKPIGNPEPIISVTSDDNISNKSNFTNTNNKTRNLNPLVNKRSLSNSPQAENITNYGDMESDISGDSGADDVLDTPRYKNSKISGDIAVFDLNSLQPHLIVDAHKSSIRLITLSNDGTLLATASKLGTIIRVFKVCTGERIAQFRRGRYPSKISCISFSNDNKYLIVSSLSHSIHIFAISETLNPETIGNNDNSDVYNLQQNDIFQSQTNLDVDSSLNEISSVSELDDDDFVVLANQTRSVKYPRNMKDLLKSSSKALSRGATKQFNKYFTNSTTSKVEPKRNIAYCTIPVDISTSSNLVAIGDLQEIRKSDYPEVFQYNKDQETMQDVIKIRKVYLINDENYILIFLFNPLKGGPCIFFTKLLLLTVN